MKIRDSILNYMERNGLFEDQAKEVLELYVAGIGAHMAGRLSDDVSDYPEALMKVVTMGVNHTVIKWIDANSPSHWARLMFL